MASQPQTGSPGRRGRHGVSARRRTVISALVGLAGGAVAYLALPPASIPLLAWDLAAVTYVCWVWISVWKFDPRQTAAHAVREDPTRATADIMVLCAAVVSLVAVGYVLARASSLTGLGKGLNVGFGVASVIASWTIVHTVFALKYARRYYAGTAGGVDFHEDERPCFSDFAYLAFTVGMTFQVSDSELNSKGFRKTVLVHSLLSYLFGTFIVALAINVIAGLTK
jgi:uncharacterized membrane protein